MAEAAEHVTLECQPQTMQTTLTLDVSSVWPHIDSFSKGKELKTKPVAFGDVTIWLGFYPKGHRKNDNPKRDTSLFVYIGNASNDTAINQRIVVVDFQCGTGHGRWPLGRKRVEDFKKAWGYSNFQSSSFLQANPVVTVHVTMYCNPSIMPPPRSAQFVNQCKEMEKWSEEEGDVTLVVTENEDPDHDHDTDKQTQEPPQKQRKITVEANQEENQDAYAFAETEDQNNELRVSGILLKSASPVFERMLETNMKESQEKRICVHARSVDDVRGMIHYLWTDELPPGTDAFGVIQLAHYFELERLKFACINRIIQTLSVENFVDALLAFNRYSIQQGINTLTEFATKNKEKITNHDRCDELPFIFKMCVLKMVKNNGIEPHK